MSDHAADARRLIDAGVYMSLATADAQGRPWVSPVWFAHEDHARFLWVSKPEARHSRNLAGRPEAAIVIFDSTPRQGPPEAVYVEADAERLEEGEDERWIDVFTRRSEALGWPAWTVDDVRPPTPLRLYLARATAHYVLGPGDERIAVDLA
jgi:pyridoxine/pyridoxamine 5'-phosphate oxidase